MKGYSGDPKRCPHCKNVAEIERDYALRWVCAVCGGPRLPLTDEPVELSGDEVKPLEEARRQRIASGLWRTGSFTTAGFGAMSAVFALLPTTLMDLTTFQGVALWGMVATPIVFSAFAWSRANGKHTEARKTLDTAWTAGVRDYLASTGKPVTAKDLAEVLDTTQEHAEALLTSLNIHDEVTSEVTSSGDITYAVLGDPRIRLEEAERRARLEDEALAQPDADADADEAAVDDESRARART